MHRESAKSAAKFAANFAENMYFGAKSNQSKHLFVGLEILYTKLFVSYDSQLRFTQYVKLNSGHQVMTTSVALCTQLKLYVSSFIYFQNDDKELIKC